MERFEQALHPQLRKTLRLRYGLLTFLRFVCNKPHLFADSQRGYLDSILETPFQGAETRQVPRIQPGELGNRALTRLLQRAKQPLVLAGFGRDCTAVKQWSPAFLKRHYGSEPVRIKTLGTNLSTLGTRKGRLVEVLDDILKGKVDRKYVEAISDIFHNHPELVENLPLEDMARLIRRPHFATQMFLGGAETGTRFHCANQYNLVLMVHGQKEWFFVHPRDSPLMYPNPQRDMIYVHTSIDHNKSPAELETDYPLYNRAPKYRTVIKPGDLLLVPAWWWHAINNITSATISVSTRWAGKTIFNSNNMTFELMQMATPFNWKMVFHFLRGRKLTDSLVSNRSDH